MTRLKLPICRIYNVIQKKTLYPNIVILSLPNNQIKSQTKRDWGCTIEQIMPTLSCDLSAKCFVFVLFFTL